MSNYLIPDQIKEYTLDIGVKKANYTFRKSFMLSFMGGMFISLAAIGSLIATCTINNMSVAALIAGIVFSAGLMMVVIAGGDLFTGNVLLIIAVLNNKISYLKMLINLLYTFIGNLCGSLFIVILINYSGTLKNEFLLQKILLKASHKIEYSFIQAIILGILCNLLVSLAVWMMYSSKDIGGKVLSCFFPITLFIIGGYEHIVANMYYIPAGFLISLSKEQVLISKISFSAISHINLAGIIHNFIPVTIGNIIGGIIIGAMYNNIFKSTEKFKTIMPKKLSA